jgi:hypothetical protein
VQKAPPEAVIAAARAAPDEAVGVNLVPRGAPTPQYFSPPKGKNQTAPSVDFTFFFHYCQLYYYCNYLFYLFHYKAASKETIVT